MKPLRITIPAGLLLTCLLLTLATKAQALDIGTDGTITNWGFKPFGIGLNNLGAGPYMGDWTNGSPPQTTGQFALDAGEYPDLVWMEDNNAAPIDYSPGYAYDFPTYASSFVPAPGGATTGVNSIGERFDIELLAWRLIGKDPVTGKDRMQVLAISSLPPNDGRSFVTDKGNYHLGDLFIDTDNNGTYDRVLTAGQWKTTLHDPITNSGYDHLMDIGLYSIGTYHHITNGADLGWYDVERIRAANDPFALASGQPLGGHLIYDAKSYAYGNPVNGSSENTTWMVEWTFDVEALGLTPAPTLKQLKNMKFHLTCECGNDYLDCSGNKPTYTGQLSGTVYLDANNNGDWNTEELGIPEVTLKLLTILDDGSKYLYDTTKTLAQGNYLFAHLPPGAYIVEVDEKSPALNGMVPGLEKPTFPVALGAGQSIKDLDFGYIIPTPAIKVVKSVATSNSGPWNDADAAPGPYVPAGIDVFFQFEITNTGNVPLTQLTLVDSVYNGSSTPPFNPPLPTSLAPGEKRTYIYGPVAATADQHTNVATITGKSTAGAGATVIDSNPANYYGETPAIKVVKSVGTSPSGPWYDANTAPGTYIAAGSDVYFQFVITNNGNVALNGLTLSDSIYKLSITLPATLGVGESFTYVLSTGKAAAGQHTDLATATGTSPANQTVSDKNPANYFGAAPAIQVIKSVSASASGPWDDANTAPGPYILAGKDVFFQFMVTNTGNVTLSGMILTDAVNAGSPIPFAPADLPASLKPGESYTYICSAPATSDQHTDTATVTGLSPVGLVQDTNPANYFGATPAIQVVKSVGTRKNGPWDNADTGSGPNILVGNDVFFQFVVTNTGNVPLTGLTLTDVFADGKAMPLTPADLPASMVPGDSYTYVYGPITAIVGQQTDTAIATGKSPLDTEVKATNPANYFGAKPSIGVLKQVGASNVGPWDDADTDPGLKIRVGGNVYFQFVVTNTGNVPLTGLTLTDSVYNAGSIPTFNPTPPSTLAPGDSYTYVYGPVTATIGLHTNTATATGTPPVGPDVQRSDIANYFGADCSIKVIKSVGSNCSGPWDNADAAPGPTIAVGSAVYFQFVITNTGNVPLTGLNLTDSVYNGNSQPAFRPAPPPSLAPGEGYTYIYGPVTATGGQHTDLATATGIPPVGTNVTSTNPANYFGLVPSCLGSGDTATIGFWHNKNGQALINTLNGGPKATSLASWLATNFPYLYGAKAGGNDMTGKTNADVAALFMKFFSVKGQKTDAQILGAAMAVYVTNSTLAGAVASQYGFNVSTSGTGSALYNVSSYGTAIGLTNNTLFTVLQLLQQANLQKKQGTFNANAFNVIFDGINTTGDII